MQAVLTTDTRARLRTRVCSTKAIAEIKAAVEAAK
jgi:hypothetical protein